MRYVETDREVVLRRMRYADETVYPHQYRFAYPAGRMVDLMYFKDTWPDRYKHLDIEYTDKMLKKLFDSFHKKKSVNMNRRAGLFVPDLIKKRDIFRLARQTRRWKSSVAKDIFESRSFRTERDLAKINWQTMELCFGEFAIYEESDRILELFAMIIEDHNSNFILLNSMNQLVHTRLNWFKGFEFFAHLVRVKDLCPSFYRYAIKWHSDRQKVLAARRK